MKKNIIIAGLLFSACSIFAQPNTNSILVRHDTTILNATECEWLIRSLVKNDPGSTAQIGKSVPLIILEAIEKGNLQAFDYATNKPIPGKEIFTWQMESDTIPVYDSMGNLIKYTAVQHRYSGDNFTRIKIFQDWYFDVLTGKFHSDIKWIEMLSPIYTASSGIFIGYAALFRIYY